MVDIVSVNGTTRILLEADLRPVQGARFQPTGFPSLGAAEFCGPDNVEMLLVESAQSMANRLEEFAWDAARGDLVAELDGLPYVSTLVDGAATDSIREAHRLNSAYLINSSLGERLLKDHVRERAGIKGKTSKGKATDGEDADESSGADARKLAAAVFHFDPNSVLHGVFLTHIVGSARLTRLLSSFIEAYGVRRADSGGVKNDRIDPKGGKGGSESGFGNIPYPRTEYTADRITAYFSLDVALLRSYGLPRPAEELLLALGLWKIQRFLEGGCRLRSACDFEIVGEVRVPRPAQFELPTVAALTDVLRRSIAECTAAGLFAQPAKTVVTFDPKAK